MTPHAGEVPRPAGGNEPTRGARQHLHAPAVRSLITLALLGTACASAGRDLFAMDTGFQVPGMNEIEQLELVRSLGFAGVTWSLGDPERLRRVGEHAERIGLRLIAVYTVAQLKRDALVPDPRVDGVLAAMRGLAPRLWLAIQSSDFARSSEAGDEPAVDGLRRLADRAAAAGVTISLYHHSGYWMERIEHAVRLARKTARPNVVVTFNLAHWLKTDGRNLAEHLDEAMPLLDSVTINGATVTNDTSWANLIQPLHRGTFDWAAVVRELDRRGFRGPICLQLWGIGGLKQDNLRNSIAAWRAAFP